MNSDDIKFNIERNIKEAKAQREFLKKALNMRKDVNEHIASAMISLNQCKKNLYKLGYKNYV